MVYKSLHDAQKLHDEAAFNLRRSVAPNSSENSKVQIEENKMCWKSKYKLRISSGKVIFYRSSISSIHRVSPETPTAKPYVHNVSKIES